MAKAGDLSQFQVKKPGANAAEESSASKGKKQKAQKSNERKLKGFRIRTEAAKQLAMLKIETGTDEQDLVAEALNMLFKKYGKPQIA